MELIGCLMEPERVSMGDAAANYDEDVCKSACPHHDTCRVLKEGAHGEKKRDSQVTL